MVSGVADVQVAASHAVVEVRCGGSAFVSYLAHTPSMDCHAWTVNPGLGIHGAEQEAISGAPLRHDPTSALARFRRPPLWAMFNGGSNSRIIAASVSSATCFTVRPAASSAAHDSGVKCCTIVI